jgi:hypothetical protein
MSAYEPPTRFPLPTPSVTPFKPPQYHAPKPWDDPQIEPLAFLLSVMRSDSQPMERRMDAAKAAAPYRHRVGRTARLKTQSA